jgi:myo-inositol-1(or 4)-monophosphatase
MRKNFLLGMKKEWKADHSPVTETDKTVNAMVVEAIHRDYPHYGIVAEEGGSTEGSHEYTWVCDPVDGTAPFAHGIPTFVFSLALVRDGTVILGVVMDPMMDRLYVGELGKGATLNGAPIHVSDHKNLSGSYTALESWLGWEDCGINPVVLMEEFIARKLYPVRLNSSIYSGMLVAAGELSASLTGTGEIWDHAATKIIVEEAGGKATSIEGLDQRYDAKLNGHIVTNGLVHDEVIDILKKSRLS